MDQIEKALNNKLKIIGIGASASGLQALESFFTHCPADTGLSFVVVQHLSPEVKSMYPDLLSRKTTMPVRVATESVQVEPDHIYLIPGDKNIVLEGDHLKLLKRAPAHEINLPVDLFFSSLASEKKENAVGVILSGTGSDGTKGAAAIKEAGGVVFVQNPEESGFDGMPLSVIHAGLADFVLNAGQMPNELRSYFNYAKKIEKKEEDLIIDNILETLKKETKYDFTPYRKQTLSRRIVKRKSINKLDKLSEYYDFLKKNEEEQGILVNEFLIGVTQFFRDIGHFNTLKENVIPKLIASKRKGEIIKIWVIGCVTGEEAYSLAILMEEELKKFRKEVGYKIFATDINVNAIEKASKGNFGENLVSDLEPEYLAGYFHRKGGGFVVQPHLRKNIIFSTHDILHNPPFNKMDLISCRNLLIYFQDTAQQRTIQSILYALNLEGYLFLGSSESLGDYSRYFEVIDRRGKIFKKKLEFDSTQNVQELFSTRVDRMPSKKLPEFASELTVQFIKKLALVTNSVCICVNENIQVLEAYGSMRLIGTLPFEGFSTNLLKLLPKDFHVSITTAIRTLSKSSGQHNVISKSVNYKISGKNYVAKLIFDRFDQRTYPHEKFYLIVITVEEPLINDVSEPVRNAESVTDVEVHQLQNLLEETRENLQLTIEELESSNEEAQATNEELVSSNEELQSTNEELQSVNEELYTVNVELQEKNIQLLELNSDIENLINTSHIATLFLDDRLHIRRFTPSLRNIINLQETDIGRSITNFSLPDKNFLNDIKAVNKTNVTRRKEIYSKNGTWHLQEIHSYVSADEKNQGTVINYTDISDLKKVSIEMAKKTKFLEDIIESSAGKIFVLDLEEEKSISSIYSIAEMAGYSIEELYEQGSKFISKIIHPDDLKKIKAHRQKMKAAKENEIHSIQFRAITKKRETIMLESLEKPFEINADGKVKRIVGLVRLVNGL